MQCHSTTFIQLMLVRKIILKEHKDLPISWDWGISDMIMNSYTMEYEGS